jgi:TetR/AcrR family transcriptional regulator, lmrAB and yxaGH operons repressor
MSSTTPTAPKRARTKRGDTRTNMLISAAEAMRECGAAGVTIDEVLTRSGAPRGSVYYHFPAGRNQILAEALRYAGDAITADIDKAAGRGAKVLLQQFVEFWERTLADSDFKAGCPVVAAAIGSGDDEVRLAAESGRIFADWRRALTSAFVADGFVEADADSLAVMSIAALEGAVVLCRALASSDPLRKVHEQLEFLIKAREFVHRNGVPERT